MLLLTTPMLINNQDLCFTRNIADYQSFITQAQYQNLLSLSKPLQGKKVVHINSTPRGGGVAEILRSLVPLQQSLGIEAKWYSFNGPPTLFNITKKLHNALQGATQELTSEEQNLYLAFNQTLAQHIAQLEPDILVVHDQQPLGTKMFLPSQQALARIHIDLSTPQPAALQFMLPLLQKYDTLFFHTQEYIPQGLVHSNVVASPPAIDPLAPKNIPLHRNEWEEISAKVGIPPNSPLMLQVSRFDAWKDPLGVIKAYRIVKKEFPNVQLALAGVIEAQDDPEAFDMVKKVTAAAENDADIHIFSTLESTRGIALDTFINALQHRANVVLQKSLREGFGLVVTEAMWKGRPVVGGNAQGIRLQIQNGVNGYIIHSPEQAAEKALLLLKDAKMSKALGQQARATVRENFLITRLLKDELQLMNKIISAHPTFS